MASDRVAHLISRTIRTGSGCMEFLGCVQSNGYARATVERKTDYAHRHIYRMTKGEIAKGLDVCHTCDNRKCINPDHLFLGSRKVNMMDAVSKGRQARGFMLPHTKLSDDAKASIVSMARLGIPYKTIGALAGVCRQHAGQIAIQYGVKRNGVGK